MLCCASLGSAFGCVLVVAHGYGHGLLLGLASRRPTAARDERELSETA